MEYDAEKREINFEEKVLDTLDKFTIDFVNILEKHTGYVVVSGYVSIALGRTRASEDIDLLIPKMSLSEFVILFEDLVKSGYECANTSKPKDAYEMLGAHAIRFYKGIPLPNIEFKLISNDIHKTAFENRIKLILKGKSLFISPLELQIAYKLSLMSNGSLEEISSDKDFEDAKHLYDLFKDKLDMEKLLYFVRQFKVERKWGVLQK
ncbi:MAG: hypothetical protein KJ600_01670 [Nanoarchaeota archaeon]|nr:hypothetical protein [Nanoarchaeota archaeon]MBU1103247.1 hypothetical protein [Nanoarchaeota archaeon]